jgi:NAD(P)-dependent dehydrogenase (short-subunit alcohol dehydrogenase family)
MNRLADRVVLVTGGARGLGRAIVQRCALEGATVLTIDVLEQEGRSAEGELRKSGGKVDFLPCDITSQAQVAQVMQTIRERFGRLDGLVNNAALATKLAGRSFEEIDEASWDRVFEINVKGTWRVTKAAAPLLRAAKCARIVNMASDTALWGADLFLHYVASKGAIVAMTRGMARELGKHGISVNAVAPGLTPTEATESTPERRWNQYRSNQLLARDAAPGDIAAAVAYLLSDDGGFLTGQTLAVNGGMTLG